MIKLICIHFFLIPYVLLGQQIFSIQYDLEPTTIRGWDVQHYENVHLYYMIK